MKELNDAHSFVLVKWLVHFEVGLRYGIYKISIHTTFALKLLLIQNRGANHLGEIG